MSHMRKVQNWDDGGAFTLLERQVPTLALLPCSLLPYRKGVLVVPFAVRIVALLGVLYLRPELLPGRPLTYQGRSISLPDWERAQNSLHSEWPHTKSPTCISLLAPYSFIHLLSSYSRAPPLTREILRGSPVRFPHSNTESSFKTPLGRESHPRAREAGGKVTAPSIPPSSALVALDFTGANRESMRFLTTVQT